MATGHGAEDEAHRERAGPARDFVGYGRYPPPVRWPDGASLVVNIVIKLRSRRRVLHLRRRRPQRHLGRVLLPSRPGGAGPRTEAHFEFGSRAGIWRLARLFDRYEVPVTIGACARALERNPQLAEWIGEAGHDLIGHGWRWVENSEMSEEEERDDLHRGIATIERLTGERPLGWYVRSFPSTRTRALLVEEGGFLYDSDSCNDELPWFADVGGAPFLVVPYSKVYNDVRYLLNPTYGTPRHFFELLRAGVDYLCEETARGETPKMMTIGIHERWTGQAGRTSALRDFLEYVLGRSDVRLMRRP